jgi:hypothetical protein
MIEESIVYQPQEITVIELRRIIVLQTICFIYLLIMLGN